jgi:menaquinone-dependent protoporphyrinogen oxidase
VHVLVTCASPHGSTQGIAERIAARLRAGGISVDCAPVQHVQDVQDAQDVQDVQDVQDAQEVRGVADYDAVIVGSAIHDQAWLPEASQFVAATALNNLKKASTGHHA